MARYQAAVDSAAALAAGNTFASIQAGAAVGLRLRRVVLGCRAGASVPTSQQVTISMARVTTRGVTPTSTTAGVKLDPNAAASGITGIDLGPFGTPPVLATPDMLHFSFNTQSGMDIPFELLEELGVATGAANGIGFANLANALPASHLITLGLEWEE